MNSPLHFSSQRSRSTASPCVGVFDSGVGGLSILRALRSSLPHTPLLYVADSAHAPYGERSEAYVIDRSRLIAAHLFNQGAVGLVIACNTATAIAAQQLRAEWPHHPIIGVEPGVKPAVAASRNKRIGVMATPGTLASEKFRRLLQAQAGAAHVTTQACNGLAVLIERGDVEAHDLLASIAHHTQPLRDADVDTVVLGCTHYAFVHRHIAAAMGSAVQIIDTAEAVARHAANTFPTAWRFDATEPMARLQTTGCPEALQRIASAWLPFACSVESWADDSVDARS